MRRASGIWNMQSQISRLLMLRSTIFRRVPARGDAPARRTSACTRCSDVRAIHLQNLSKFLLRKVRMQRDGSLLHGRPGRGTRLLRASRAFGAAMAPTPGPLSSPWWRPLLISGSPSSAGAGSPPFSPIRWLGVVLFTVGGALRLWPVFVLGRRFSGLVAIQPGHTLFRKAMTFTQSGN